MRVFCGAVGHDVGNDSTFPAPRTTADADFLNAAIPLLLQPVEHGVGIVFTVMR